MEGAVVDEHRDHLLDEVRITFGRADDPPDDLLLESGPPDQVFTDPQEERTRQFLRRILG